MVQKNQMKAAKAKLFFQSKARPKSEKQKENLLAAKSAKPSTTKTVLSQGKRKNKQFATAKTAQKTIKYKSMFEDGICDIGNGYYSISFSFIDINYQIAKKEDQFFTFQKWCEFLNSQDSSVHVQVSVQNKFVSEYDLKTSLLLPDADDSFNAYRKEYNDMLLGKAAQGQNGIVRDKYITMAFPADNFNQAITTAARIQGEVEQGISELGSGCILLSGKARTCLLSSYFNFEPYDWSYRDLIGTGLTTKDFVAPDFFNFAASKSFEFHSAEHVRYGQVIFLKNYPPNLQDRLIREISDIACDLTITQHISPVEHEKARQNVMNQIAKMDMEISDRDQKARNAGAIMASIPFELQHRKDEALELLDDLTNKDQRMFKSAILVYTCAETQKELADNVHQIMSVSRKNNCGMAFLDEQQEAGLNSILPIGQLFLDTARTLNTAATGITIPFATQELMQPDGVYYGVNALSHKLLMFNRINLLNSSGFILGVPGSGKSFKAKEEIISVLMRHPNDDVIILDPEREFTPIADAFGGEVIHISAGSKNYLNPMDISDDYSGDDDPLLLKTEFLLSLCEMLICGGKQGGLSAQEHSIIDRAISITYERFFSKKTKFPPTLKDFYEVLKKQPEAEAQSVALSLELYIQGSLSVFANQTNVKTKERLVIYDTRDLGKKLKALGLLIVLDQVWNRITSNKAAGKRTWLYTDEFYLLFQDETSANYYYELYKRARKYGCVPTGMTQNVTDLLNSATACTMLSNAEFLVLLSQSSTDLAAFAELRNLSKQQQSYVTNVKAGSGLLIAGKAIVPFTDDFPKETKLYQMMTTKFDEVVAQEKEKALQEIVSQ